MKFLLEKKANSEALTRSGATPLHYAARWGSQQVLMSLVNQEVGLDRTDSLGRTPLHYSVFRMIELNDILLLIKAGCDLNIADHNGMTPLHLCCKLGNLQFAKLLLWNGALAKVRWFFSPGETWHYFGLF